MSVQVVILAAGMGTRLGRPFPKPLTPLKDGRTIMAQQLGNVRSVFDGDAEVMVVVGFKLEQVMEAAPEVAFAYNELYDQTNTSKSLLKALRATGERGVLWMNGDVVFHPEVLRRVKPLIEAGKSFVCVNTSSVAEEEVKYTVDADGFIADLSKQVPTGQALGEAVGINFIAGSDKKLLVEKLVAVDDQDYFERGIEIAIAEDGLKVTPVDISDLYAVEVDFDEDLERANEQL
ncbi:NTP transferase domain-containing protein [Paraoerskovia marina]|uniref:phosphocholine cytidylyltransferase family protein n=1 Tax=Paraoerskovia marina TaxID=545619 RepID=UPI0004925599|nr:phosphocholine cytidylyltransferase family protein [Paraoerskovia marina]